MNDLEENKIPMNNNIEKPKKSWLILLIIIAVLVIGGLIYYYVINSIDLRKIAPTTNNSNTAPNIQNQVQPQTPSTNNSIPTAQSQVQSQTPTENYVKCNIDGQTKNFTIGNVSYEASAKEPATSLSADETGKETANNRSTISLTFGGNKTRSFIESEANSMNDYFMGIQYSPDRMQIYDSNYIVGFNNNAQANITKYSGNNIEGTFSGILVYDPPLGKPDESRKFTVQCSFSSSVAIKNF